MATETQAAPDRVKATKVPYRPRYWALWWLSPTGSVMVIAPITLLAAWKFDNATYLNDWRTPKVLTTATVLMAFGALLVLMICGLIPQFAQRRKLAQPWPAFSPAQYDALAFAAKWVFRATVFGYLAMFGVGIARGARPATFVAALTGGGTSDNLKDLFAPVTGVTTFTQFGIAYVVLATILALRCPPPYIKTRIGLVLALGLFRAFFVSERLAIIELVFPIVVIIAMMGSGSVRPRMRQLAKLSPILLVPAAVATFSVFEYFRTWTSFYSKQANHGFVNFAIERFAGYYVTAYNNGQIGLNYENTDGHMVPYNSLAAIWTAPGIAQVDLYAKLNHGPPPDWMGILAAHGNPELNNTGGLQEPFVDFGTAGGFIFFAAAGLIIGMLYLGFKRGSAVSVLVYPPLVTGLFEIPRYLYWTQGRFFPALVALIAVGYYVSRKKELSIDLRNPAVRVYGGAT